MRLEGSGKLKQLSIFKREKDGASYLPVIVVVIAVLAIAGVGVYFALESGPLTPAQFEVSNLSINSTEVEAGKTVSISTTVTNTGDLQDTYTVTLKIDGAVESTRNVTLAGGASQTVSFTVTKDIPRTYAIEVDGIKRDVTFLGPPVIIVSHTSYREEETGWIYDIYGEVQNVSTTNIRGVIIKATIYDNRGYIIDSKIKFVYIPVLVPNQKSPFRLCYFYPKGVRYELEIFSYSETSSEPYREFNIPSHELMANDGSDYYTPPPHSGHIYVVRGKVVNIGNQTTYKGHVCVTFYDTKGNVIGCGDSSTPAIILGPKDEPYDFIVWGPGNVMPYPASYILQVYEGYEGEW